MANTNNAAAIAPAAHVAATANANSRFGLPTYTSNGAVNLAKAHVTAAASARRYAAHAHNLTAAFAARTFTLTAAGQAAVACGGAIGKGGAVTVMGLTAVAVGIAANGGKAATGAAIVAVMLHHPMFNGVFSGTKANGTHVVPGGTTAAKWAQGYVNGLARPAHALAK